MTSNAESVDGGPIGDALVEYEGEEVVLCFDDRLTVPTSAYDGHSYQTETTDETTIRVTVAEALIEDEGASLHAFLEVDNDERERVGISPDAIGSDEEGAVIVIGTSRDHPNDRWDDPKASISVRCNSRCHERRAEGARPQIQYDPPNHPLGTVRNVIPTSDQEAGR